MSDLPCPGNHNCPLHFHDEDPSYLADPPQARPNDDLELGSGSISTGSVIKKEATQKPQNAQLPVDKRDVGFRRIIRNFTPSYVQALEIDMDDSNQLGSAVDGSS